ncbi:MAG: MATE family efflux transporter [Lachnospiraceae bacterium]|nr:MATE family efflux transporter [Lachnospiraceae bacterium]
MQYLGILAPILVCEFMWSLGENVYAAIYGNIGTDACAAMTMTGPIQGLMIGALSGLAQAAGILIGKSLGNEEYDKAYKDSKRLMWYGLAGSLVLSVALVLLGQFYVRIYNVEPQVRTMAYQLLVVFAIVSPVKVQNMILGGGIIRSGGKTQYVMWVDLIGTWIFGVPLGLLSAFVFDLPITYVYFILSMEEVVRLLISVVIFRKKRWMRTLE